ncbi:hypothetical protein ATANTOWER_012191 [Ataeniobius toweri]|uniref:Uncharacterized protein n=1 Tax=Ataeniobius toweri TaxID=208326 RepID=A0ABU7AUR8_9TELE|nr:hypothetical protein [Ataeniobius toweri]
MTFIVCLVLSVFVKECANSFHPSSLRTCSCLCVCVCVYQTVPEHFISIEAEMALNSPKPLTPGNIPVPASLKCAGASFQKTTDLLSLFLLYLLNFLPPPAKGCNSTLKLNHSTIEIHPLVWSALQSRLSPSSQIGGGSPSRKRPQSMKS